MNDEQRNAAKPHPSLRERAESLLDAMSTDIQTQAPEEVKRLLHELHVHQIELEMQNENLREAQLELEAAHDRYLELYDFSPVGYLALDINTRIHEANLTAATLLGIERKRLLGERFSRYVAPESQDALYLHQNEVFSHAEKQSCELRLRGGWRQFPVLLESIRLDNPSQTTPMFRCALIDITERKRAEEALALSEAQHRAVVEMAADGFWMLDGEGRILAVNQAYAQRSGYSREELLTMSVHDVEAQETPEETSQHIQKAKELGADLFETWHRAKDGERWPVEVNATHWPANGDRFFAFLRDVGERKKLEQESLRHHAQTEAMLKQQVALQTAAAFAHELNQPLLAIAAYGGAALLCLQEGGVQVDRLRRALEGCNEQTLRAGRVLHQLVEQMHGGEIQAQPFDLNTLITEAINMAHYKEPRKFQAVLELEPDLPKVVGNPLQTKQVLSNLVRNGIEAMRDAKVPEAAFTLTVRSFQELGMAHLTIHDNGPGLDRAVAARLFEPFYTTKTNGLGLGLAISRSLAELQGGRLWADPQEGPGAVFHLTLGFAHE